MIASVHIGQVKRLTGLGIVRKAPEPAEVPGLLDANVALTAPLGGSVPKPALRKPALVALWEDDAALDRFLAEHPTAEKLADGWRVRLEPLRVHGSWPGVPEHLPRRRQVELDGPAVVLTLGRFRLRRARAFFRTSAKAEADVLRAPGLIWTTGMARPPFVATCSLWESADALRAYAYGGELPGHPAAIDADRADPFHHRSAFVRFRPYDSVGHLDGKNPLPEDWMSRA